MPTFNRRHLLPLAIECYLSQDWKEKELIVVDDGTDCVEDVFSAVPGCRYFRTEKFPKLGDKVNFACEQAQGEVIVTWDDDDWYAPNRISDQVNRLGDKSLSGYHTILFYDGKRTSQYRGSPGYATGSSQVYRKDFWSRHRFTSVDVGYDNDLSFAALAKGKIICADGSQMLVARIHGQNVSGHRDSIGDSDTWPYVSNEMLPKGFTCLV